MVRNSVVIDTNIWMSAYFRPDSVPGKAVQLALENYTVSHSPETWEELKDVLSRPEFNKVAPVEERMAFANSVAASGQFIQPAYEFYACKDPKDNKFLSLAYAAGADCIISGDEKHLQPMKHFMGVQIWSPEQFIQLEHEKARETGRQLSAQEMADQLLAPKREAERKPEAENLTPGVAPDFNRGLELRRKRLTDDET